MSNDDILHEGTAPDTDQLFAGALLLFIGACSFFILMAWARFGTPPDALYAINGLLLALGAALRYVEVQAR